MSAKENIGTQEILEAIVGRIPPPKGEPDAALKALVIDSVYNSYRGVVMYVRVFDGSVKVGDKIRLMAGKSAYEVEEVGVFLPHMKPADVLSTGSVGYVIAGVREIADAKIGETITDHARPTLEPLPGYREMKPLVFCGLYPADTSEVGALREALERLKLNDDSFRFEPEISVALGFGFRCGFLDCCIWRLSKNG